MCILLGVSQEHLRLSHHRDVNFDRDITSPDPYYYPQRSNVEVGKLSDSTGHTVSILHPTAHSDFVSMKAATDDR